MVTVEDLLRHCVPAVMPDAKTIDRTILVKAIYVNLAATTMNREFAEDLAIMVYSSATETLYSDLQERLIPYRAIWDSFTAEATPETADRYIMCLKHALAHAKRTPSGFRKSLLAASNTYKVPVPAYLWKDWTDPKYSANVKFRIAPDLYEVIKIFAGKNGTTFSDYCRSALYDRLEKDKCLREI